MIDDPLATNDEQLRADIDALAERYGSGARASEIAAARGEFDERRGRVFDDDELFTLHMSLFLEWYCLERSLSGSGRTPVLDRLASGADLDAESHARHLRLACSQRGLFEVTRSDAERETVVVHDLVRGAMFRLEGVVGVEAGEVFEGRVMPDAGRVILGPVVLFHPREARERIAALVTAAPPAQRESLEIVDRIAEMRLRYGRFRNIAVHHIYA
ncbi:MAG: hypothetical protein KC503_42555 [Myxococcales bacterium]|nr:hypothetical protein [Myxococcales bacterium]